MQVHDTTSPARRPFTRRRVRGEGAVPPNSPGARKCYKCSCWRPEETFEGYKTCKSCRDANRAYHLENIEKRRQQDVAHRYGITREQYAAMYEEQGGRCKVCGKIETRQKRGGHATLEIDHNHTTGEVRGLLCRRCNQIVGFMDETSFDIVERAWLHSRLGPRLKP